MPVIAKGHHSKGLP